MKTAMPGYYRKNAACGVVHKAQASPADRRDAVVQVVYWCLVIAMHETLGMGKERLEKFGAAMSNAVDEYETKCAALGVARADAWLEEKTAGLVFVLPADRPIKKDKDRMELARKRQAEEPVWRLCAAAMGKIGYGDARRQRWLDGAKKEYLWFLEWAKDGDGYGFERLRAALEQILHEEMELTEEPGKLPVFSDRIW